MIFRVLLTSCLEWVQNFMRKFRDCVFLILSQHSFESLRVFLSNFSKICIVTIEYAKSVVLNEEMRKTSQGSSSLTSYSDTLVTVYRGKSKSRGQNDRDKSRGKTV